MRWKRQLFGEHPARSLASDLCAERRKELATQLNWYSRAVAAENIRKQIESDSDERRTAVPRRLILSRLNFLVHFFLYPPLPPSQMLFSFYIHGKHYALQLRSTTRPVCRPWPLTGIRLDSLSSNSYFVANLSRTQSARIRISRSNPA